MMNKETWKEKLLSEVLDLNYGKGLVKKERKDGSFPVYGSGGIVGYHNTSLVKGPGIIIGRKGSVGTIYYEERNFFPIDTVFFVKILDTKETDLKFLYYFLKQSNLKNLNSDAAVPGLKRNSALRQAINIPKYKTQKKIGSILSNFDKLIENNSKRIKILERTAHNIYQKMFVKFNFGGGQNSKMKSSEIGPIPIKWNLTNLGTVLIALESGKRPKGGINKSDNDIPSIGAENIDGIANHDFTKEKYVSHSFYNSMKKGIVRDGDVGIYKDGAYIGKSTYFGEDFPHKKCCVNEHVFLLRTNNINITQKFLYIWFQQKNVVNQILALNTNAAQPGINQKDIRRLKILVPEEKIIKEFDNLISPFFQIILNLAKKNLLLQKQRDLLLPYLISGRVDVSRVDMNMSF